MKDSELKCCRSNNIYRIHKSIGTTLFLTGFEAGVIDFIREDLSVKQKIILVNLSIKDLEVYFLEKSKSKKEYCIELLSKKWYCRETDVKLQLTKTEFEDLDYRTFSQLKQACKLGKLSIAEMNIIIKYFTDDYSYWYNKD